MLVVVRTWDILTESPGDEGQTEDQIRIQMPAKELRPFSAVGGTSSKTVQKDTSR
jgi:hypothetical protein